MKRANEIIVKEEGENSGLKKVRFLNGNDEDSGDLALDESEEQGACVENGETNSGQEEKNENPSLLGLNKSSSLDFDLNIGLSLDDREEQKGFLFDLNFPAPPNGGPAINERKVNGIAISSDDNVDEVVVLGHTHGYNNAKGKEIEIGAPSDGTQNLLIGLEVMGMNDAGESSSLGCPRRFTREEKGKDIVDDTCLSLKVNSPTGYHLFSIINESSGEENAEIVIHLPQEEEVAVMHGMAEGEFRIDEQALANRGILPYEIRLETARRLARANFQGQNNPYEPSGQSKKSPDASPVKQLGSAAGPFCDALEMVRGRTSKGPPKGLIKWKPLRENHDKSITATLVPSLLDLSLKVLAENAECMISLDLVPDNLRERLTNRLCGLGRMGDDFLKLLVAGCPTEIRIKNSSWLTEKQFLQAFGNSQTKDLRVLQLDLCGKCMLDFAFEDIISRSPSSFSSLAVVSLRGACRLSDNGLRTLLTSAPLLRSINLGYCSLLTSEAINFIADSLGPNLRELFIDDCQKIDPSLIFPAFRKFKNLEVLSVANIDGITDSFISEAIFVCGGTIKELDLADCPKLSDCCLKTIGDNCADLCSLNISNLPSLTDLGIEYLANGCRSIQRLKMCRNEFSDEAVAAYIESSGKSLTELSLNHISKVGPNTALSLASRSRNLLSLDVSFCRGISDEALGLIVDSCSTLKLLKIFGCRQITNVFLNGHSNRDVRIIGSKFGPILEHVNLLQPEGLLLRHSPLPEI